MQESCRSRAPDLPARVTCASHCQSDFRRQRGRANRVRTKLGKRSKRPTKGTNQVPTKATKYQPTVPSVVSRQSSFPKPQTCPVRYEVKFTVLGPGLTPEVLLKSPEVSSASRRVVSETQTCCVGCIVCVLRVASGLLPPSLFQRLFFLTQPANLPFLILFLKVAPLRLPP